jgi:hypothetical protein
MLKLQGQPIQRQLRLSAITQAQHHFNEITVFANDDNIYRKQGAIFRLTKD